MKKSEMLVESKSSEKRHKNIPKIIRLEPPAVNEDVLFFRRQMYGLKNLFDRVDQAGAAIGEEKLACQMVMMMEVTLTCLCQPAVRDSIRPVPEIFSDLQQNHRREN